MYIFCFFNSVLHNKVVFLLKFEDNSMKEEELQEFIEDDSMAQWRRKQLRLWILSNP
jgi:hypothetical protein